MAIELELIRLGIDPKKDKLSRGMRKHLRRVRAQDKKGQLAKEISQPQPQSQAQLQVPDRLQKAEQRRARQQHFDLLSESVQSFEKRGRDTETSNYVFERYGEEKAEVLWMRWQKGQIDTETHKKFMDDLIYLLPSEPARELRAPIIDSEGRVTNRLQIVKDRVLSADDIIRYDSSLTRLGNEKREAQVRRDAMRDYNPDRVNPWGY